MKYVYRSIVALVMIFVISSLTFFLVRLMPGDPIIFLETQLEQKGMTAQQAADQIQVMLNIIPHQPLLEQYREWLVQLLHGNLGQSIQQTGVSVRKLIFNALPWTLITVAIGLLGSYVIGIVLGVVSAYLRRSWVSSLIDNVGSVAHAVPAFVTGIALLYLFTVVWHVFPSGGAYGITVTPGFNLPFILSFLYHMILPGFTYVLTTFGSVTLSMKSSTITTLNEDFMMAARIRGLPKSKLMQYLGSNSILPLFTGFMISLGVLFSGSIFIEQTFQFPGIGNLLATAVNSRDYPVMEGCFMLTIATVIVANLLADVLYAKLDPRINV
ncbi:ABC transporter permease [Alicyclobacillus acidiphilus]|uniref:ABC transporter permease n=1 Tax=Alicyclobacillus acidiphilus TaxID=182455 RepID=UPI0008359DD8|nr:ABC transporter permease [Alicyclobacillus acidiphilus]